MKINITIHIKNLNSDKFLNRIEITLGLKIWRFQSLARVAKSSYNPVDNLENI